jgi:hypothetical protein
MADIFTVDGVALVPADDSLPVRFSERFGTIPSLVIQRRGIALGALPDVWLGKEVTWEHDGTTYFIGDVVSVAPSFTQIGWVLTYQCLGIRNRLDHFPHTDDATGTDTSGYNLTLEDPAYDATRAGRTVGEILLDVLTMPANASAIDGHGLGGYTSLSPPTLPAATLADLAALTLIPPQPIYFTGERLGGGIDGFLQRWAPNSRFWPDRDGVFRILDLRTFSPQTLTMGTDPIEPSELTRDVSDCFQRVVVRGQPIAVMAILKLSLGQLIEVFTHDGYLTNAAAKAAWTPADFRRPGTAQDSGDCTCPSTTTVTVTSDDAAVFWSSNFWDASNRQGAVNLSSTSVVDYTQYWSARVVSNTALTAGGTSTLTLDSPLPHTSYDRYTLSGLASGGSVVWTQYEIANTDLWPRVAKQSTYPQPFINAGGGVTMISTALGCVLWSSSGSPPYNSFPLAFTYNGNGRVRFISPTYTVANNAPPSDVWVALPINTNPNEAAYPPDSGGPVYGGTSHTVDGLDKTLTVDAPFWRDPGQLGQILAYATDLFDAVSDAVVEGSVVYYGFYEDALTFGLSLTIEGDDGDGTYDTPWDGLALPVTQIDIEWPEGEGMEAKTTCRVSNRTSALPAQAFMHPEQSFLAIGGEEGAFDALAVGMKKIDPIGKLFEGGLDLNKVAPQDLNDLAPDFDRYTPKDLNDYGPGDLGRFIPGAETNKPANIASNPAEYFQSQGIATNPADYFRSQGIARSPEEFFGGGGEAMPEENLPPEGGPP